MSADNQGVTPPVADVPAVDPSTAELGTGPDATIREAFAGKVGVLGATEGHALDDLEAEANAEATKVLDEVRADAVSDPGTEPYGIWKGKADRGPGVYEFKPIKFTDMNEPIPLKPAQKFDGSGLEVDPTTVGDLSSGLTDLGSAIEENYDNSVGNTQVTPEVPTTNAQ